MNNDFYSPGRDFMIRGSSPSHNAHIPASGTSPRISSIEGRRRGRLLFGRLFLGVLAAGMLLGGSGCTVVMGLAGAAIDGAIVTAPVWYPGAHNKKAIDNGRRDDVSLPLTSARQVVPQRSNLAGAPPVVLIQPIEGPLNPDQFSNDTYSWWGMVPLLPYANSTVDIRKTGWTWPTGPFSGEAAGETLEIRFPLSRFPEGFKPSDADGVTGDSRRAAADIVAGELVSLNPSAVDRATAWYQTMDRRYLYGLTLFVQKSLQEAMGGRRIALQAPDCLGRYEVARSNYPGQGNQCSCDPSPSIEFKLEESECVASLPPSTYLVTGRFQGYPAVGENQIVVSGRLRFLRMQTSNITYGLTYIGADLLSYFGLPLSSNRLVGQLELRAHRGGNYTPILDKRYDLVTERRTVGLYYGGDFAKKLNEDLTQRMSEKLADFAAELQPLTQPAGSVASAAPSR